MSLTQKRCIPCEEGIDPMEKTAIQFALKEVPNWELVEDGTAIQTKKLFKNFIEALDYVNQVGELAELENHHPDIQLGWGYVTLTLQTHSIGGLHENDFIMAAKIDAIS